MLRDIVVNYLLPLLIYGFITGVANLALAHKSQIESWAESHPRYAGYLKFQRAIGLDPWNLVSAVSLWSKKRLPNAQQNGAKAVAAMVEAETPPASRMFPSSIPPAIGFLALLCFAFNVNACSSAPPKPPCDPTTLGLITAECSAQAFECGRQGIPRAECAAIADCNARLDERAKECRK